MTNYTKLKGLFLLLVLGSTGCSKREVPEANLSSEPVSLLGSWTAGVFSHSEKKIADTLKCRACHRVLDLRRCHKCESIFASLGRAVYRGSSQELQSPGLPSRDSRAAERKVLGAAPIWTY